MKLSYKEDDNDFKNLYDMYQDFKDNFKPFMHVLYFESNALEVDSRKRFVIWLINLHKFSFCGPAYKR